MRKLWSRGVIIASIVICSSFAAAGTITVTTDGSADHLTIQAGINAATDGDIVQVTDGEYTGDGNRDIDFKGKAITVKSANGPENCIIDCQGTKDEPHRGFIFQTEETSDSILQGVTIINGYGQLVEICDDYGNCKSKRKGGGIFMSGASPTIKECVISQCRARYGGAFFGEESFPNISECIITENFACESYPSNGAGIYGCSGEIENCVISNNTSDVDGGAISNSQGTISNCTITGNKSIQEGGALHHFSGTIFNSVITGNSTGYGGGLSRCEGTVINCTIYRNSASKGGGLFLYSGKVINCIVWGNSVEQFHGYTDITNSCIEDWLIRGDSNTGVDPLFIDVSSDNYTDWDLHLQAGSNCIDSGQNASVEGLSEYDIDGHDRIIDGDADGAALVDVGAFEHIQNVQPVIKLNNTEFVFSVNPVVSTTASQILTISNGGNGVLQWELAKSCDWLTLGLKSGSSNNNGMRVAMNVDATNMPYGKHECSIQVNADYATNNFQTVSIVLFVAQTLRVPSQYPNIQAALDAASDGDIIMVADGTYTGHGNRDIDFKGKAIIVSSENGPGNCVIDCQGSREENHRGFIFQNNENYLSVINGLTITNGYTYGERRKDEGAAINCLNAGPTIKNCVITSNVAEAPEYYYSGGGGISGCNGPIVNCVINQNTASSGAGLIWCSGLISNCTISGNTAYSAGGGAMRCHGLITECTFSDNSALFGGGIDYCDGSIVDCTISNNRAKQTGGGIYGCSGTITNCIITGNSAEYEYGGKGGGLARSKKIINCTIVGNYAKEEGGGLYECTNIVNCIIRQNKPEDQLAKSETPTYSCVQGDMSVDTGNIDADPFFVNPGYWDDAEDDLWHDGDYHLQSQGGRWDESAESWVVDDVTSPCIDAGDMMASIGVEPFPNGGILNMGAYGGTAKASKSYFGAGPCTSIIAGDINGDCVVDLLDFSIMAMHWMDSSGVD